MTEKIVSDSKAANATSKGGAFRILMIGDVVGRPGRRVLTRRLGEIREKRGVDFVVVNAENAYNGSGLSVENYNEIVGAGTDVITLGDHAFRQKSVYPLLNAQEPRAIRPANFPTTAPGRGWTIVDCPGTPERPPMRIAVMALLGRVFINQPIDNPMTTIDRLLDRVADVKIRILDFHTEATSEIQAMGRYLDGRVSAVLGTHTHVATADEKILPGGTAFQCDVGMTGAFDSVIGRKVAPVIDAFRCCHFSSFEVAENQLGIDGTLVDVDPMTGKALAIERLSFREEE